MVFAVSERASVPIPSASPRPHPRLRVVAVLSGAAATAFSAAGSWIPSLWGDEVTSVLSAERSLPSLFTMLGHVDAVHGSYYFLLHFWVLAFGASPFSVRFLSALAVGAMTAGIVLLAERVGGMRMAVLAGIVSLLIPRTTYMGEEARSYALSAACAVWVTYLLLRLVTTASSRKRGWILYAIGIAVCGYIFLFSLLLLVAHASFVLGQRNRAVARSWVRSLALAVVLGLPVIGYGVAERGQIAFLANRSDATFQDIAVSQWFENDATAVVAWALLAAAIAMPLYSAIRVRFDRAPARTIRPARSIRPSFLVLLISWLLAPTAILIGINAVDPIYSSRYLSFCVPAVALVIASLLVRFRRAWLACGLMAVLAATAVQSYIHDRGPYAKNGSDWATDAALIQSKAAAGDGIIFDTTARPSKDPRLAMGAYPSAFAGLVDIEIKSPWYETTNWHDSVYPLSDVTARLTGVNTVWVIEYRAPGKSADTYDLSELGDLGYSVTKTYREHSSVILKLQR